MHNITRAVHTFVVLKRRELTLPERDQGMLPNEVTWNTDICPPVKTEEKGRRIKSFVTEDYVRNNRVWEVLDEIGSARKQSSFTSKKENWITSLLPFLLYSHRKAVAFSLVPHFDSNSILNGIKTSFLMYPLWVYLFDFIRDLIVKTGNKYPVMVSQFIHSINTH